MKKTSLLRSMAIVSCAVCSTAFFSCTKKVTDNPQPAVVSTASSADAMKSSAISTAISPFGILGKYYDRGSRTVYRGQEAGDNVILSIDYFNDKKITPSLDNLSLVCGYGETNFVNMGWQYVIRYNPKTREILLSPNAVMAAAIQPGSFETRYAIYDASSKTFNFVTRFTAKDGNESEVFDILTKE